MKMLVRNAEVIDKVRPMGYHEEITLFRTETTALKRTSASTLMRGASSPTRHLVIQDGHHGIDNCIDIGVDE